MSGQLCVWSKKCGRFGGTSWCHNADDIKLNHKPMCFSEKEEEEGGQE